MARIERATSPLPRECSTTEPHGRKLAAHTRQSHTWPALERETGIEPASLAWKAKVLPLNYSRPAKPLPQRSTCHSASAWWRRLDSNQRRRKPTDLQSAPFSHSGTPPGRARNFNTRRSTIASHRRKESVALRQRPWRGDCSDQSTGSEPRACSMYPHCGAN